MPLPPILRFPPYSMAIGIVRIVLKSTPGFRPEEDKGKRTSGVSWYVHRGYRSCCDVPEWQNLAAAVVVGAAGN